MAKSAWLGSQVCVWSDGCSQDLQGWSLLSVLVLCAHKDIACNAKEQVLLDHSRSAALLQNCTLLITGNNVQHTWFMAFKPGERLQVARMSSEGFGWNLAAPIMFPCTNEYKMVWSVAVDAELLLVVAYNITQQLGSCNATWSMWCANGWTDMYLVWSQRSLCTIS